MMQTIEERIRDWVAERFDAVFPGTELGSDVMEVRATANEDHGDYQCNAAMRLAKPLRQPPRAIAERFVAEAGCPPFASGLEVAGPGFINIRLDDAWLARQVERLTADDRLGTPEPGAGRTIIIDYSSPNVAKPMHIGHIRSTVIGNALDRLHRFIGYRVVSDNHLGDWGTQFGLLLLGYRHFVDPDRLAEDPVAELERLYVKSYNRGREEPGWRDQAKAELVKLQAGDEENTALWKTFVELSLHEFDHIYRRLNVSFDLTRGESFYNDRLAGIVRLLQEKGLAEESEGALVVFLDEAKEDVCIVRKADGGYNYATTDLATVQSRMEEFAPETVVYVTDERQQRHFRQIFTICGRMGWEVPLAHVWFGLMRLPEGTFSTREGNVIKLDALLDEAEAKALQMVQAASPEMEPERQVAVSRAVGIGAVKYADLSQNPQSLVTFTWEKALSLDGNSAPYLQYAHARICSVLDKYRERFPSLDPAAFPLRIDEAVERRLALRLARFPETVIRAAHLYRPNLLADYLYDLSQQYSSFYQNLPFLRAEEGVRESRIRLCALVAATLRKGLDLLGIEAPERI